MDSAVTDAATATTICCKGGYTSSVRPPESLTEPAKRKLLAACGIPAAQISSYELDHLIDLAGGGASDIRSLWPEPNTFQLYKGSEFVHNDKDAVEAYPIWPHRLTQSAHSSGFGPGSRSVSGRLVHPVEFRLRPYRLVGDVRRAQLTECFIRPSPAHRVRAGVQKRSRRGGDVLTVDGQLRNSYEHHSRSDRLLSNTGVRIVQKRGGGLIHLGTELPDSVPRRVRVLQRRISSQLDELTDADVTDCVRNGGQPGQQMASQRPESAVRAPDHRIATCLAVQQRQHVPDGRHRRLEYVRILGKRGPQIRQSHRDGLRIVSGQAVQRRPHVGVRPPARVRLAGPHHVVDHVA
ncbi:hypothetical protein ACPPVO_24170 [Dactylosporangium sp. McL0621]|uniref:hypothetical protein n=1 Tax=Dactylosporangium sp. McL0621 TaxID=3415678 RepID=UPI003CF20261